MAIKTRQQAIGAARGPREFTPRVLTARTEEAEQVHLFSIVEGDETREFYVPRAVKFNVSLKAAEMLAEHGEAKATVFMLRALLGDQGYEALINFDDLTEDDFKDICDVAQEIVLGKTEGKAL